MPRLMLFVPCDRVSYDVGTSAASVIGVFQGFTVTLTRKPPSDASTIAVQEISVTGQQPTTLPIRWAAFALWRRIPDDADREFTQTCELIAPSGKVAVTLKPIEFRMIHDYQRNTMNINNFPVDEAGDYLLKLTLKEKGAESEAVLIAAEYPIAVTHRPIVE